VLLTCHGISWSSIRLAKEEEKLNAHLHVLILCFCDKTENNMWSTMVLTLPGHVVELMQDVTLGLDLPLK
jgi:hypothetical protein